MLCVTSTYMDVWKYVCMDAALSFKKYNTIDYTDTFHNSLDIRINLNLNLFRN